MDVNFSEKSENLTIMAVEDTEYTPLSRIPAKYAYSGIFMSLFFFQCISRFVVSFGLPKAIPPHDAWRYRNLLVSWIHAILISVWDIWSFYYYGDKIMDDPIDYQNISMYWMISFTTGYFLYDYLDTVMNVGHVAMWEIVVHHYAVGVMFIYNLITSQCVPYSAIAISVEINTTFLHSRKILQMNKVSFTSLLYRVVTAVNLLTFLVFRFVPLGVIVWGMFVYRDRVSTVYFVSLGVSMFFMIGINMGLFWRLLRSDLLRKKRKRTAAENEGSVSAAKNVTLMNGKGQLLDINGQILQSVSKFQQELEQLHYGFHVVNPDPSKDKDL